MIPHLFDRLAAAKACLAPVQGRWRIVWEDPDEPDSPARITIPDPNWLAAAMAGDVLPGSEPGSLAGALSEEQAMERLITEVLPPRVWRDYRGNRQILAIVPLEAIPTDRRFRAAWSLAQIQEQQP